MVCYLEQSSCRLDRVADKGVRVRLSWRTMLSSGLVGNGLLHVHLLRRWMCPRLSRNPSAVNAHCPTANAEQHSFWDRVWSLWHWYAKDVLALVSGICVRESVLQSCGRLGFEQGVLMDQKPSSRPTRIVRHPLSDAKHIGISLRAATVRPPLDLLAIRPAPGQGRSIRVMP